jgi:hypothetical protein
VSLLTPEAAELEGLPTGMLKGVLRLLEGLAEALAYSDDYEGAVIAFDSQLGRAMQFVDAELGRRPDRGRLVAI